ncbi:TPA: MBL fold metallo-hydrolase [bacterium]|nr:MBL fold metallo-hydrolase [bacterium]
MKLIFHGGAREVGKSCIELVTQEKRFLLDAGLKFKENGFEAPFQVFDLPDIDGLFLSHAHLDHTGALPLFEHFNLICPIFTTQQTKELTKILLKDSYKIARIRHLHPAYKKIDLRKVYNSTRIVEFNKWYKHVNIEFKFLNAGHVPGSAMILIKVEGKKILYTGDYKYHSSELMKGIETEIDIQSDLKDIDVMITESTYGGKPLPDRGITEDAFLDKIIEVIRNGSVIIPVFGLGRAQEILILLSRKKWPVPVYLDGMAVNVTNIILSGNPSYINERKKLQEMYRRVDVIKKEKKRKKVMNNKGIFITTSGMLQGGPIMAYLENMWGNSNDAILMTGFQCKRTNGRLLLDEGYVYINGWKTYVKAQYQKFDFSGHSDDSELKEFIRKINPKNLVINHGDETSILALKAWADRSLNCKVYAPSVGESIDIL